MVDDKAMSKDRKEWLDRLLAEGESETVEFKESLGREALETIAAFANTRGGALLIGVRDDGTVRGITLGKESLHEWANHIAQATHLHPRIGSLSYEGKTVVIEVPESPLKPVPCRGRYLKRVAKSNRQMTDDDLTRAVLEKIGIGLAAGWATDTCRRVAVWQRATALLPVSAGQDRTLSLADSYRG